MENVAFAEGAVLTGGFVFYVEWGADYEDVRLSVGEETRDAAGAGVGFLVCGFEGCLAVFYFDVVLDLFVYEVLHVRREGGAVAGSVWSERACGDAGVVVGLEVVGDYVVGEPGGGAAVGGVGRKVVAVVAIPRTAAPSPAIDDVRETMCVRHGW